MSRGVETDNSKPSVNNPQPSNSAVGGLFDFIGTGWLRLERFSRDIAAVLLFALAVLTLLGFFNLTTGAVISPWAYFLRRWLGWGSLFFVAGIIAAGIFALRKAVSRQAAFPLGRVLALEGLAFVFMALLSLAGGNSLDRADAGQDGGVIGWALADVLNQFLPAAVTGLVLLAAAAALLVYGLGVHTWISTRLQNWMEEPETLPVEVMAEPEPVEEPGAAAAEGPAPVTTRPARTLNKKVGPEKSHSITARRDHLPPLDLLLQDQSVRPDEANIHATAEQIELTLLEFGIPARVVGFRVGPTVTQYAVEPGYIEKAGPDGQIARQKIRISQISALQRDLALRLSAERLRIEAPVPGHSFVGVEVPNSSIATVRLRSMIESANFARINSSLGITLGRDVSGQAVVADLARMPHMLIAGTTGSGKSVCIQALVTCLVMNNDPQDLKLAMIDPKMVELVRFNGLPHLLGKVEIEPERMQGVMQWAIREMDSRYRLLENAGVRDLESYNRRAQRKKSPTLPRIVVLIDELADLMMAAPDVTETSLVRLAQMARAVGIHLVVATQRPSTDVLTGLIKANFPARIAFTVATAIDSRVILDTNGAETLLGRGDMLFLNPESGTPVRAQGVIVSDAEIEAVVGYWKKQAEDQPAAEAPWEELLVQEEAGPDQLVKQAIAIVKQSRHASASMLQRRLRIGYPRAARLIDELESLGVVGPSQPGGREREVLWSPDDADLGEDAAGGDEDNQ